MSIAFRLFLAVILISGVVWLSRYRREDIAYWLRAPNRVEEARRDDSTTRVRTVPLPIASIELRPPEPTLPRSEDVDPPQGDESLSLEEALFDTAEPAPDWPLPVEPQGGPDEPWTVPPAVDPGDDGAVASGDGSGSSATSDAGSDTSDPPPAPIQDGDPAPKHDEKKKPAEMAEYTVRDGDSLARIAKRILGKEHRWTEIRALNEDVLHGSTQIVPGMTLRVPKGER